MSTPALVTRDSIRELLNTPDRQFRVRVIGRALVGLFERQTAQEKSSNHTIINNWVGFAAHDAKSGTLTAKYFLKNKDLLDWQVERWMKIGKTGYPRLCKYHRQLNEIAIAKQSLTPNQDRSNIVVR